MTKFTFVGMPELKAALKALPEKLSAEAGEEIREVAMDAADSIRAAYSRHRVTGNLANGVRVKRKGTATGIPGWQVASTAPHASIFEKGTEARHYITQKNGVKKLVGRMPAAKSFGPIIARYRRFMWDHLITLVTKHGLLVRGDAA